MFDWILKGGQIPSFSCVLGLLVNFKPNGDQSDFQLNFRHLLVLKVGNRILKNWLVWLEVKILLVRDFCLFLMGVTETRAIEYCLVNFIKVHNSFHISLPHLIDILKVFVHNSIDWFAKWIWQIQLPTARCVLVLFIQIPILIEQIFFILGHTWCHKRH